MSPIERDYHSRGRIRVPRDRRSTVPRGRRFLASGQPDLRAPAGIIRPGFLLLVCSMHTRVPFHHLVAILPSVIAQLGQFHREQKACALDMGRAGTPHCTGAHCFHSAGGVSFDKRTLQTLAHNAMLSYLRCIFENFSLTQMDAQRYYTKPTWRGSLTLHQTMLAHLAHIM